MIVIKRKNSFYYLNARVASISERFVRKNENVYTEQEIVKH